MKEALQIYKLTPRKQDDGGNIVALPNNAVPASNPNPTIKILSSDFSADSGSTSSTERVSGTFTIHGELGSLACDMTPGERGTISEVTVFLNGATTPTATVPVQVTKGTGGVGARKYPYAGVFTASIPANVVQGTNSVRIQAIDKVFGNLSTAEVFLEVRRDAAADPTPTQPAPGGFTTLGQPFTAEIALAGVDVAGVADGSAALAITVRSLLASGGTFKDTVRAKGLRGWLKGDQRQVSLQVSPATLAAAQAGTLDSFAATVDCPSLTWKARTAVFRKTPAGTFSTDYWSVAIAAGAGLDGGAPITVTAKHGSTGPVITSTLTLSNGAWRSTDSDVILSLAASSDADGLRAVTATLTSPTLGAAGIQVQALRAAQPPPGAPADAGMYDTAAVRGMAGSGNGDDGRQTPLGLLRPTEADLERQDDRESMTVLSIEVEGTPELLRSPDFRVQTKAGARRVVEKSGKFYVADAAGANPEAMVFVAPADAPSGGQNLTSNNEFPNENDNPFLNSTDFILGFKDGFTDGGQALVVGTWEVLYEINVTGGLLLLSWGSDDARDLAASRVETGYTFVTETGAAISDLVINLGLAEVDIVKAILTRDIAKMKKLKGQSGVVLEAGLDLMVELKDEYTGLNSYDQGYVFGRSVFEIAMVVAPFSKPAQLAKLSKAQMLSGIVDGMRTAKWFETLQGARKAAVERVLVRVTAFVARINGAKWVGHYGADGAKIYEMYVRLLKNGRRPIDAMKQIEKDLPLVNPYAINAGMLDAIVEQRAVAFYVRADGARIPQKAYVHINPDHFAMPDIQAGTFPPNPNGRYFTFDKFDEPTLAKSQMQLPPESSAKIRIEFDTTQISDEILIPHGNYQRSLYLEPVCADFPSFGVGGATQGLVKNTRLQLSEAVDLVTNQVIFRR